MRSAPAAAVRLPFAAFPEAGAGFVDGLRLLASEAVRAAPTHRKPPQLVSFGDAARPFGFRRAERGHAAGSSSRTDANGRTVTGHLWALTSVAAT